MTRYLLLCVALLTLLSLAGQVWKELLHRQSGATLVRLLDLNDEMNIPTAFQVALLVVSSAMLARIGVARRRSGKLDAANWFFLAMIFLYLSVDEGVRIHERMGQFRDDLPFHAGRIFRSGWVMFGFLFAALIGLLNVRFLLRLPRATAARFIIAGVIYVAGAGGMEAAAGPWITAHGKDNFGYVLFSTLEEVMEMLGVVLFICALLIYRQATRTALVPAASTSAGLPASASPATRAGEAHA